MKKGTVLPLALALVLAFTLAPGAAAAEGDEHSWGVYDLNVHTGYTLKPLTAAGGAPKSCTGIVAGVTKTVYDGVEKFTLSFAGDAAKQYVAFLLSDGQTVPTGNSVRYIDQTPGTDMVTFNIYPDTLQKAGTYTLLISSDTLETAATFQIAASWKEAGYTLGDVNGDGKVNPQDALMVLEAFAGKIALTETQKLAANINNDFTESGEALVNVQDALGILLIYAKG